VTADHKLLACLVVLAWSFINVGLARDLMRRATETREQTEDLLDYIEHRQGHHHDDY
jgi:hypothetical protein